MVLEDFFAVGALDLVGCGAVAVFGEAEDGVMVLALLIEEEKGLIFQLIIVGSRARGPGS